MLNYIWISLILVGVFVAVGNDVSDEIRNPYRNGQALDAVVELGPASGVGRDTWEGQLIVAPDAFNAFYGVQAATAGIRQPVVVTISPEGESSLAMQIGEGAPGLWKEMAKSASSRDRLTGTVQSIRYSEDKTSASVRLVLEPIRYVKLRAVTQAALDYAATAVNISLGLIGIMALWLGVMKVAEEAGLLIVFTRLIAPLTKRLFPDVPPDHPAVGAMVMNIAANMLGLNNAATPMGLKAMEELNKLNPKLGTATNAMVTFLAINTGGLVLIPATAMAVRAAAGSSNPAVIIGTSIVGAACATTAGILAAKLLQRLPGYRKALEVTNE